MAATSCQADDRALVRTPESVVNCLQPSKDVFPFLQLSAELRLIIYRMALQSSESLDFSVGREKPKSPSRHSHPVPDNETSSDSQHEQTVEHRSCLRLTRAGSESLESVYRPYTTLSRPSTARDDLEPPPPLPSRGGLSPALLATCRQIHREARTVLYGENELRLELATAQVALSALRQPTRSLIREVRVALPAYNDVVDEFADLVRLALRYCWGLHTLTVLLPAHAGVDLADTRAGSRATVYANSFHILRWLPKGARVVVEGDPGPAIRRVIEECGKASEELDEAAYLKRQHQMTEGQ